MSTPAIEIYISESSVPRGMRIQAQVGKDAMIVCWGDTAELALENFEKVVLGASAVVIGGKVENDERFQKIGARLAARSARRAA